MAQKLQGHIRKYWHWWILGLLSILYLALQYNRFFNIISWADTDDALQYVISKNLSTGHWLGPYNRLTLIKGIGFPAWTASLHILHIPLWLGNGLLAILSCAAVVYALRRTGLSKWVLVGLYGLLLFNPLVVTRAYRDVITPSVSLLVCAWAIGMFVTLTTRKRQQQSKSVDKDLYIFSAIGLVALPMWYYVREDPLWLITFVCLLLGGGFVYYIRSIHWRVKQHARVLSVVLLLLVIPFVAVEVVGVGIASLNRHYYGRYVINDYFSSDFKDAYAALARVQNIKPKLLTIPISYEMRQKVYAVSPAFKTLEHCLDGGGDCEGNKSAGPNAGIVHDYEGGWFPFALRSAVEEAGDYASANKAKAYYVELTKEINTACASGALTCHPPHMVSLIPLPTPVTVRPLAVNWASSFWFLLTLRSDGNTDSNPIGLMTPANDIIANYYQARYATPRYGTVGLIRNHVKQFIYAIYRDTSLVVTYASVLALAGSTLLFVRRRAGDWRLIIIAWLLLGTIMLRTIMLAYIQVVSFPTASVLYLSSTYPLLFLFEGISLGLLVWHIQKRHVARNKSST